MTDFDCKDIRALLSGFIDGELDDATHHQVERHLVDCKACRELVNESETLNDLLVRDAGRMMELPESFENAVLRQTIYAEAFNYAGRRWTSWLGWVAAAASLGLAASLWFLNPRFAPVETEQFVMAPDSPAPLRPSVYAVGGRSWTYDGSLAESAPVQTAVSDETFRAVDNQLASVIPISYHTPAILSLSPPMSQDDADTLFAAANLLDMLTRADLTSFADVERIRQIAEYDELVPRLGETLGNISGADRALVMAAESILLRIVRGPLSVDDLESLRETVHSMDLADQIHAIAAQTESTFSL